MYWEKNILNFADKNMTLTIQFKIKLLFIKIITLVNFIISKFTIQSNLKYKLLILSLLSIAVN